MHRRRPSRRFDEASAGASVDLLGAVAGRAGRAMLNRTEIHAARAARGRRRRLARVAGTRRRAAGAARRPQPGRIHGAGRCRHVVAARCRGSSCAERGRLMQAAVPQGVGAMAAVLGADDAQIAQVCARSRPGDRSSLPANYNSPGPARDRWPRDAVDRALARDWPRLACARRSSSRSACRRTTPLMREAAATARGDFETVSWSAPKIPVVQNADAERPTDSVAADRRRAGAAALPAGALDGERARAGGARCHARCRMRSGQGAGRACSSASTSRIDGPRASARPAELAQALLTGRRDEPAPGRQRERNSKQSSIYRILTGPDDDKFCRRVSEALALGYVLYGSPAATFDGKTVAQAAGWSATYNIEEHR